MVNPPKIYELLKNINGNKQISYKMIDDIDEFVKNSHSRLIGYREKGATTAFKEINRGG